MRGEDKNWLIINNLKNMLYRDAVFELHRLFISIFPDDIGCRYVYGIQGDVSPVVKFCVRAYMEINIGDTHGNAINIPRSLKDCDFHGEILITWGECELLITPADAQLPISTYFTKQLPPRTNLESVLQTF